MSPRDLLEERERFALNSRSRLGGLEGDDQRARAAELVAEALVVLDRPDRPRENQAVMSLSMFVMLARGASTSGAERRSAPRAAAASGR